MADPIQPSPRTSQLDDFLSTPLGPGVGGEDGAATRLGEVGPVPSTPAPPTVEGFDEDDD